MRRHRNSYNSGVNLKCLMQMTDNYSYKKAENTYYCSDIIPDFFFKIKWLKFVILEKITNRILQKYFGW